MAKAFNMYRTTVLQGLMLQSITIDKLPAKLDYTPGEAFDPDGMIVIATFDRGVQAAVTGYSYTPTILDQGIEYVTIAYGIGTGEIKTATVQVSVKNRSVAIPYTNSTFTYNGSSHAPTWINYNNEYMSISGTQSAVNAGTYSVTFTLKEGYVWEDDTNAPKSISWSISKANSSTSLSTYSLSFNEASSATTVTVYGSGGSITAYSSNNNVATVNVSGSTLTITPGTSTGRCTITVGRLSSTNYNSSSASLSVTKQADYSYVKTGDYTSAGTYTHVTRGNKFKAVLISGGGGGAPGEFYMGGGGGSASRITVTDEVSLASGSTINIVVGAGGTGGTGGSGTVTGAGGATAGGTSSITYSGKSTRLEGGSQGSMHATLTTGSDYQYSGYNGIASGTYSTQTVEGITFTTYRAGAGGAGSGNSSTSPTYYSAGTGGAGVNGGSAGGDGGKYQSLNGKNGTSATVAGSGGGGGGGAGRIGNATVYEMGSSGSGGNGAAGRVVIFETGGII